AHSEYTSSVDCGGTIGDQTHDTIGSLIGQKATVQRDVVGVVAGRPRVRRGSTERTVQSLTVIRSVRAQGGDRRHGVAVDALYSVDDVQVGIVQHPHGDGGR